MATNPYFKNAGFESEQNLYEDIIIECLKIYGQDFQYIPREIVREDQLFGEDTASRFDNAYDLEMYVENVEGYEGQELFQKFGVQIDDESTIVVSRKRFNTEVGGPANLTRPREGDLVFVPFSKSLFEITFVEHEEPFYQLNNLPVYKLRVSLFNYNAEDFNIPNTEFDTTKFEKHSAQELTLNSTGNFIIGEVVTQIQTSGTVTGDVVSISDTTLIVSNISSDTSSYNVFEAGFDITSAQSGLTRSIIAAKYADNNYDANNEIETEADTIIDFSETNPFGEY